MKNRMQRIAEYAGKYYISIQFWGQGNYNIFIEKDNIDLLSAGGFDTPNEAIDTVLNYLDKINSKTKP